MDVRKLIAATVPAITNIGTAGAVTVAYKLIGVYASGRRTAVGAAGTTTTSNATLTSSNYNRATWVDPAANGNDALASVEVYRTTSPTSPSTTGLIATVAAGVQLLNDTGLAGAGVAPSTTDSTGNGTAAVTLHMREKSVQLTAVGTGTYQLQGSLDNVNWINEGTALTASSTTLLEVSERYAFMRFAATAYTSGTPRAYIAGGSD